MAEEETELEPSGYVTSDGKDLDERYLFLKDKDTADDILETVVQGIGVMQQDPIKSSANPYTMPKDGYVTWRGSVSHTGVATYEDWYNWVHFYLNDIEIFSKQSPKGNWDYSAGHEDNVAPNVSHTLTRICKQNDVLKIVGTGTGPSANRKVSQTVEIAPYTLYRFDQIDEDLSE